MPTYTERAKNWFFGSPIPPKDTEGIAKLVLFDEDENCEEVVGCIVRNNDKLVQLINPKHLYVQKYKKTKYFAYFKDMPARSLAQFKRASITVKDSTQSPNEIITCKVDDLVAEEKIAKEGDCHAFVPCDSPDFNNSTFLRHYSKNVNIDQELGPNLTAVEDTKFYALGKDKEEELICLELKRDEQTNNTFIIDSDVYDKLVDGPLFLDDKTTVVGCYAKDKERRKITIHFLGKKDVWTVSYVSKFSQETTSPSSSPFDAMTTTYNNDADGSHNNDADGSHENDADGSHENDADGSHENDADGSHENDADGRHENDSEGSHENDADGSHENDADGSHENDSEGSHNNDAHGSHENNADGSHNNDADGSHENDADGSHENDSEGSHENDADGSHNNDADGSHENDADGSHENDADGTHENDADGSHENDADGSHENDADGTHENDGDSGQDNDADGSDGNAADRGDNTDCSDDTDDIEDENDDNQGDEDYLSLENPESLPAPSNDNQIVSGGTRNSPVERSLSFERSTSQNVPLLSEEKGSTDTKSIPHKFSKVTLSELCQKDSTVVQELGLLFDKRSNVKKGILSLADKVNAHHVIKSKCNSNYDHSPASELLNRYEVGILSVQVLLCKLRKIQRDDLADMIVKDVKSDDILNPVDTVLLAGHNHELFEQLTSKLDESGTFNWRRLGIELGVEHDVLDKMETETNPAENFLIEYAYTALRSKELTVSRLYEDMKKLGREEEMKTLFEKYGIATNDSRSMKDVFRPYSVKMEALCQLLNKNHCSKGWLHLAELWGLQQERYLYYIPDTTESPTRILLEWVMMKQPEFTVSRLCGICRGLDRADACDLLEKKLKDAYDVTS